MRTAINTCPNPDCRFATRVKSSGGLYQPQARDENGRWHGGGTWTTSRAAAAQQALASLNHHRVAERHTPSARLTA